MENFTSFNIILCKPFLIHYKQELSVRKRKLIDSNIIENEHYLQEKMTLNFAEAAIQQGK